MEHGDVYSFKKFLSYRDVFTTFLRLEFLETRLPKIPLNRLPEQQSSQEKLAKTPSSLCKVAGHDRQSSREAQATRALNHVFSPEKSRCHLLKTLSPVIQRSLRHKPTEGEKNYVVQ